MPVPRIEDCLVSIENAYILLDTCFFVDYSLSQRNRDGIYVELVSKIKNGNNHFLSIYPVALEFLKGANLISEFQKKSDLLNNLVETWLPVDQTAIQTAHDLIQIYRSSGKDMSSTDFILGAALARYSLTYLLTRDHGDFPVKIFDRVAAIPIQHENGGVDVYGLFKYSEDKAGAISLELLNIHKKNIT